MSIPKVPKLLLVQLLIVLFVSYNEYYVFRRSVSTCSAAHSTSLEYKRAGRSDQEIVANVLLLSDPQLLDMRSYPGRPLWLKALGIWITDSYMRKSYSLIHSLSRFDQAAWVGDLLDSGVDETDRKEHDHYTHRFHMLFPERAPTIYLAGNHDLGLHQSTSTLAYTRERFTKSFGPLSGIKSFGQWDLVWIDSLALLEPPDSSYAIEANSFVTKLMKDEKGRKRVLLSHVPLFRPEGTDCGPKREHFRPIYQGRGKNYQNELDKTTSTWLLRSIRPRLIYSGDDHDACTINHTLPELPYPTTETTVKSFSLAMGITNPGYTLLSLSDSFYVQTDCILPDQFNIYLTSYLPALLLVLIFVAAPHVFAKWGYSLPLWKPNSSTNKGKGIIGRIHNHRKSASRKILLAEDDDTSIFPTFPTFNMGALTLGGSINDDEMVLLDRVRDLESGLNGRRRNKSWDLGGHGYDDNDAKLSTRRLGWISRLPVPRLLKQILLLPSHLAKRARIPIGPISRDLVQTIWMGIFAWVFWQIWFAL